MIICRLDPAWCVENMGLIKDASVLHAALIGYQQKRAEIESAIARLTAILNRKHSAAAETNAGPVRKRKPLSAAARKRITAAQKKRWAEYRKRNAD